MSTQGVGESKVTLALTSPRALVIASVGMSELVE